MTWNKCEELRPQAAPVKTYNNDWQLAIALGLCIVAASFVVGVFDGLDKAMEAQEKRNHLSVYCQQYGAIETLCAGLKDGGQ